MSDIVANDKATGADADHGILSYEGAAVALRDWVGRVLTKNN